MATMIGAPGTTLVAPERTVRVSRARETAWHLAAIAVIWMTSLAVGALWISGGGIQSTFAFDGETLTTLGRLTGLVSANLLLYQVLLMARVPLFERGFGRDGITRLHRSVGFWSLWLLVAHVVLITAGYAATAGVNPLAQLWDFIWDYPGMLLATAGTILLVMVVVTSIRRARRRLRYESWHLLHLYGYLGVGLAIPHMVWTGADFLSSPPATLYWWSLWAVTAACVVVFRIFVPLARSARHDLRVASVSADGSRGLSVRLRGRALRRLGAEPGQFFVWRFLDGPAWMRGHPFSLAAAPTSDEYTLAVRRVGDGTDRMASLPRGTRVVFEGPYGTMTGARRQGNKLLMFGAGAGVAPLIAILEGESFAPGDAAIVTRDHAPEERLGGVAIGRLAAGRGVTHYALDGRRSHGASPWIPESHVAWAGPDLIHHLAPDLENYDVFVCGPEAWMDSLRADLRAAGVPSGRIHHESFAI